MTSNFKDYEIIIQARKSKKFRELDDQVRDLAVTLGKGKATAAAQKQYRELARQRDLELASFYENLQTPTTTFDRRPYQKIDNKITLLVDKFIAKFPYQKTPNVVFMGGTGTGKTYLAQLIAYELTQKSFRVHFSSTFNLVKRMNDNLYGQDPDVPTDFFESDLLIIDDLGAEPSIKNSDDFLYTVINERYSMGKSFLITTNLNREQINGRYDNRLFSRIFDKNRTAVITFNGKDLRIE